MNARRSTEWLSEAWRASLLESGLDPHRLAAGRSVLRRGDIEPVVIEAGRARSGSTVVEFDTFDDDTWERVMSALEARAVHAAALADHELVPTVLEDLEARGVRLVAGREEMRFVCDCGEWIEPCRHAAAILEAISDELARDPFCAIVLRGRDRGEFLGAWTRRHGAGGPEPTGVDAGAAWAGRSLAEVEADWTPSIPLELSAHLQAPTVEVAPPRWDVRLPAGDPVDPEMIDELAADATERALLTLSDGAPSGLDSSVHGDVARRALRLVHTPELTVLAARVGESTDVLRSWAAAWRIGGDEAVRVLAEPRSRRTDQEHLAAGRDALVDLGFAKRSIALNWDSLGMPGGIRFVVGADGRWYRLRSQPGTRGRPETWWIDVPPSEEIEDLVSDEDLR